MVKASKNFPELKLATHKKRVKDFIEEEHINRLETEFFVSAHLYKRAYQRNISPKKISMCLEYGMKFWFVMPRVLITKHLKEKLVVITSQTYEKGSVPVLITCYKMKNFKDLTTTGNTFMLTEH